LVESKIRYVAETIIPKLAPAPLMAQNKSLFSVSEAVRASPLAVMILTEIKASATNP
jgi:hypothetical protein